MLPDRTNWQMPRSYGSNQLDCLRMLVHLDWPHNLVYPWADAATGHPLQVTSLASSTVAERLQTRNTLVSRINARLQEVEVVKSTVDQLPEVEHMRALAPGWRVEYNLAAWSGGKEAYKCAPAFLAAQKT